MICAATALRPDTAILINCLLGVVLGMSEDASAVSIGCSPCAMPMRDASRAAIRIKRLDRVTIPVALSQPAASHILPRA
jgi:hypothetical protein